MKNIFPQISCGEPFTPKEMLASWRFIINEMNKALPESSNKPVKEKIVVTSTPKGNPIISEILQNRKRRCNMRKVENIEEIPQKLSERNYTITLDDGSQSDITLIKDEEWVLKGDSLQLFCLSELTSIRRLIKKLNKEDPVEDCECGYCDDSFEEDESYYA